MNDDIFACIHCSGEVISGQGIGTLHRNHCPFCLWSLHVDDTVPGDRASTCRSAMEPIGLTLKREGVDKYGKPRLGELMIIHRCTTCGKVNINRIAGDDNEEQILSLLSLVQSRDDFVKYGIIPLTVDDTQTVKMQLFGYSQACK